MLGRRPALTAGDIANMFDIATTPRAFWVAQRLTRQLSATTRELDMVIDALVVARRRLGIP